jgi:hypothetical protein
MTVKELIARLQEDDIPPDAIVDYQAYSYSSSQVDYFKVNDVAILSIKHGPNTGAWVTLISEDI